ncbi:MAG: YihY/virulence factor BrkB family protein [Cyclobacteriaceae bacterium]|nr:YihY/virulence factor BrkB family protein [Cyclobacteriaceae bacterium]
MKFAFKKSSFKDWWTIIKDTFKEFFEKNPLRHCAAIAYYTIFSMPGIAIISVLVAGSFYEDEVVREELIKQIRLLMGDGSARQVEELMGQAVISGESIIMKIVGIVTLIISTTTVFASLQDSLNTIWNIKPKPRKEVVKFLFIRLLSLAMVASLGFLILVSLMADTLLAIFKQTISGYLMGASYYVVWGINLLISMVIITFVFALIFKVLPDAQIKWKNVWVGAIVTTILFLLGKNLIGYYLGTSNFGEAYGAAGSLVALLAWVYYSVLILLFGAEFTFVYNRHFGNKIKPIKHAVTIKVEQVEAEDKSVTDV